MTGFAVATQAPDGQQFLWYSGGKLAKDLPLPALRAGWSQTDQARSDPVFECGSPRMPGGVPKAVTAGRRRGRETAETWGAGRPPTTGAGREAQRYAAEAWTETARRMAGVVAELAAIPVDDRAG